MRKILIDDNPELKAIDNNLNLEDIDVAKTCEAGIKMLSENERYETLYLDYQLPDGNGFVIIDWLSDHMDKVPTDIFLVSFGHNASLRPYVEALMATAKRNNENKQLE